MKTSNVILLVKFLFLFLMRRVLGRGILATSTARWISLIGVLIAFVTFTLLSVVVLRDFFDDTAMVELMLRVTGLSTAFWVMAIYTVLRVLFLKSDELIQLTYTLPATNRQRVIAFSVFEAFTVGVASVAAMGAITFASMFLAGADAAFMVLYVVIMPVVVTYLLLNAIYQFAERILLALGIARLRSVVVPVLLAGGVVAMFVLVNGQTLDLVDSYIRQDYFWAPQLVFFDVTESFGPLAGLGFFLLVVVALSMSAVYAAPSDYEPVKKFFKILPSWMARSRFGAHIMVLARSFESLIAFCAVVLASLAFYFMSVELPPYFLLLLTFQGVYVYASSEPLRRIGIKSGSTWKDYLYLVGPQASLLVVAAVPTGSLSALQGTNFTSILLVIGFCLVNIVVSTMVGIIFPPEKGNPFSVFIGLILMITVVLTLSLGINIFSLPTVVNIIIISCLSLIVIFFSILGMRRIEMRDRNEMAY